MQFPIYIYIALLILAALLSTRLMKVIKLPNVTGYILTGIIMGPFIFGLFFNGFDFMHAKDGIIYSYINRISWLSTVALGFIAFSIGTSFKASVLKVVGKRVIIITVLEAVGASLLVIVGTLILHFIIPEIVTIETVLTLGAIASATAPAATLMVIKQYKAKGSLVDTLLPVVALDDAAALILFAILFQIASSIGIGGGFDAYKMFAKPLIEIVMSVGFGGIIGLFICFLNRFFKSRNNRLIMCIFSIFLALGLNTLFKNSELGGFELSSLLMCMVSGALYTNFSKDSGKTFDLMERFTAPIYLMFFVISGASLDLTIFFNEKGALIILVAFVYIIFRVIGKYLGALSGAAITKSEPKIKKYLGLTLIPQAGVAIGLATSASQLFGAHPNTAPAGAMILAIILTSTLVYELFGPMVSKYALTKAGEIPTEENETTITPASN